VEPLTQWGTVALLSATPALVLGQTAAVAAGLRFGLDPWKFVPVIALAGFLEGLFVAWLGGRSTKVGIVHRWCEWMRKPKAVEFARRWGPWGGMFLGVAAVGQEPILISLRWLDVGIRKLILPIAASNAVFAVVYYAIVKLGFDLSPF
jgi:membrane protein YqaA with SNARE-associated domain